MSDSKEYSKQEELDLYSQALDKWGERDQISMAMGECGELIAVLNRWETQKRGTQDDVRGEIADVEILLGQLRLIFGPDAVDVVKNRKLARLKSILNGETYHPHAGINNNDTNN